MIDEAGARVPHPSGRRPGAPATVLIEAATIGEAWVKVAGRILADGVPARLGAAATRELARVTLAIAAADPDDPLIARHGDPVWLAWMRRNFREPTAVPELGGADSYAVRLRDWSHTGRDQVAWLADRLASDAESRDAAITTFQPPTDTTYVPCVSLLDAWAPDGRLELLVYAHSLDFGKKAYGNLVELSALAREIAERAGLASGGMVVHVKSAHIYEPELAPMRALVAAEATQAEAPAGR